MGVGLGMSSTAVVQSQFDPEATLAAIDEHRADGLVVVPVMLQRILALGGETLARYDTSSLRYIASSGSALGATLATATLRRFGPILYNIYGSTEVSLATIAGPGDLQAAPSTAGKVAPGSTVRILDARRPAGRRPARVGRVFVGSGARFDGYTGGGGKEQIDGLLSSGDLGHFDADGRLFIDGRDDDMIVSGGENVFPAEVEELLADAPGRARGRGDRRARRGVRAAPQGLRREASGGDADPGGRQGVRPGSPCAVQGPAYGGVRGCPAPNDDRQAPAPRPLVTAARLPAGRDRADPAWRTGRPPRRRGGRRRRAST